MMDDYIPRQAAIDAIKGWDWQELYLPIHFQQTLEEVPAADVVPWSFLERYADWFCALVQYPEFIGEAKRFYLDSIAAMEGGEIDG